MSETNIRPVAANLSAGAMTNSPTTCGDNQEEYGRIGRQVEKRRPREIKSNKKRKSGKIPK